VTAVATDALTNATGDTIDYSTIGVTTAALAGVTQLLTLPATLTNRTTTFADVTVPSENLPLPWSIALERRSVQIRARDTAIVEVPATRIR
jgi:hypothetical protein